MNTVEDWIIIGRFGRPHGIKGFVIVHSFTEPLDNIMQYPWHAQLNKQWHPLVVQQIKTTDKYILALIEGYETREKAALLTNVDIAMPYQALPDLKEGEFYWHELIGMRVLNEQAVELGVVTGLMPTGAHDILLVKHEQHECMIPYVLDRIVLSVNQSDNTIIVDWDAEF